MFELVSRERGKSFLRLSSDPSSYVFITEDGLIKYGVS